MNPLEVWILQIHYLLLDFSKETKNPVLDLRIRILIFPRNRTLRVSWETSDSILSPTSNASFLMIFNSTAESLRLYHPEHWGTKMEDWKLQTTFDQS